MGKNHVFTRIGLFRLMPKLIDAMPKKTLQKYQQSLLETLLTKQWAEKRKACLDLVTPTLIKFWIKSGAELRSEEMKPHLLAALKHKGKEARFSVCDFIAKCTMFPKKKKQLIELFEDREIVSLLGKAAMSDKESTVKIAGCMAMHGLDVKEIMKKSQNRILISQWEQLKNNKRGKKNLDEAIKIYEEIQKRMYKQNEKKKKFSNIVPVSSGYSFKDYNVYE